MAFLVNFRLRSDSEKHESEASRRENGACAFKVKSAGSQKAFHFSTTKSLGERYLSGFSEGLGGFGQSPARRGALDRPGCPEPAQRPRGGSASRAPRTHRCWAAGTAWRPRSGPCLGSQGQVGRSRGSFGPRIMGPLADRFPSVHFPVRAELPAGSPHLLLFAGLPARPAAAGAADPAQRMPVIPLCRLAGVKGHGGGERGSGRRGRWNEGGEEVGRGEAPAGPAAPAGAVRPATPQG